MNANHVFLLAVAIGIVAGLRAMTAPALVSWAAHLGWLNLQGTPLAFMGSAVTVAIFSLGAIGEYVNDKLPKTPSRTAPPSVIARMVMGGLSGACVCAAAAESLLLGALLGAIGAVIGTFGGYQVRTRLVRALNVKDIFVAIPEDLVAIGLAYFLVSAR
jgi:uncharacterized membrane protein